MITDQTNEERFTKFLLKDDVIEIVGSEEFVSKQVELFKESINTRLKSQATKPEVGTKNSGVSRTFNFNQSGTSQQLRRDSVGNGDSSATDDIDLDNVFVITGTEISIIADMPGDSTSQRMIYLIVIYLYAKAKAGVDEVSFKELREVCEKYGEIDRTNFSKIIHKNRRFFLMIGEGKSQTVKLIRPGIKEAERLVSDIINKNL